MPFVLDDQAAQFVRAMVHISLKSEGTEALGAANTVLRQLSTPATPEALRTLAKKLEPKEAEAKTEEPAEPPEEGAA